MIIELPFPDPKLNPNQSHGGWKTTERSRVLAKQTGYIQTRNEIYWHELIPAPFYEVCITFYPPDKRHRDADNLHAAMKHYLDGVCEALGINDKLFRKVTIAFGEIRKPGATTVEIKVLGVEE